MRLRATIAHMEQMAGRASAIFFSLTMKVQKQSYHLHSEGNLALVLDEGQEVALALDEAELVPNIDVVDSFGSLCERGIAQPFLENAPGDHVEVSIRGLSVKEDDALAVLGEVQRRAAPGDGYRDVGAMQPHSIQVRYVAGGENADKMLNKIRREAEENSRAAAKVMAEDKNARAEGPKASPLAKSKEAAVVRKMPIRAPALIFSMGLVLLVFATISGSRASSAIEAEAFAFPGLFALAYGMFWGSRRRYLPDLRRANVGTSGTGKRTELNMHWGLPLLLGGTAVALLAGVGSVQSRAVSGFLVTGFSLAMLASLARGSGPSARATTKRALQIIGLVLLSIVATLIVAVFSAADSAKLRLVVVALMAVMTLGLLLRAYQGHTKNTAWKSLRSLAKAPLRIEAQKWCALEGQLEKGSYQRIRIHKWESSEYTKSDGTRGTTGWWDYSDKVKCKALVVKLDTGERLEVAAHGAAIASAEPYAEGDRLIEEIEPGHYLRIVGRPEHGGEGWSMQAAGVDSLLVLGSSKGPAGQVARTALRMHLAALLVLGGIAAMSLYLMLRGNLVFS